MEDIGIEPIKRYLQGIAALLRIPQNTWLQNLKLGAVEGIRTLNSLLDRQVLWPLSYDSIFGGDW